MIGPKLNARSYAVLILAAIALAVGGKLIAQESGVGSQFQGSSEVAAATRDVAAATREVAASNNAIAEAIKQLATSVDNAAKAHTADNSSSAATESAAGNQGGGVQPVATGGNDATGAANKTNPGVFEMNKK
ncbi:hypothetical protein IT570_09925 [Candidatus Sumerlaeota bacterium]|nr:hypothetical protein [Candidatus Sumerlaeota bacterium]